MSEMECEQHGGKWGDDPTCARCTYEDGTPRPMSSDFSWTPISTAALPEHLRDDFVRTLHGLHVKHQDSINGAGELPEWVPPNGRFPMSPGLGLKEIVTQDRKRVDGGILRGIDAVCYNLAWRCHDTTHEAPDMWDVPDTIGTYQILGIHLRCGMAAWFLDRGVDIAPIVLEDSDWTAWKAAA